MLFGVGAVGRIGRTGRAGVPAKGGPPAPVLPWRAVATRTFYPSLKHATHTEAACYSFHDFRSTVTGIRPIFVNGYADPAVATKEAGSGGPCTYSGMIFEYPIGGTQYPVTVGGTSTYVAADNEQFVADTIPVTVTPGTRGVFYCIRQSSGAGRIVYGAGGDNNAIGGIAGADRMKIGTGAAATAPGTPFAATSPGLFYGPCAIIGETNDSAALIVGDSLDFGSNDKPDATGLAGPTNQFFGSPMGCINVARGSEKASDFIIGHGNRAALGAYATIVHLGHGTNDATAGDSAATTQANLATIAGYFPGKIFTTLTDPPNTTSTDGWITPANQTVKAGEAARLALNAWKTGGNGGGLFAYVWDWAAQVETAGKWSAANPALTDDGIHATILGSRAAWKIPNVLSDLAALGGTLAAYDPAATAYFAAMATQPSALDKIFLNYFIGDAKYWGIWAKADMIFLPAVKTSQAALLNLVAPTGVNNLVAFNSPTFTADVGFTGNGTSAYLATSTAASALTRYTRNSGTLAFWQADAVIEDRFMISMAVATNSRVQAQQIAGTARGSVNDATLFTMTGVANSKGLTGMSRIGASARKLFHNATLGGNSTLASAPSTASAFTLLRDNANYATGTISFAFIGSGLADAEIGYLYANVANPYMYSMGVPNS